MENKELIIRYFDNELVQEDIKLVEDLITNDSNARKLFEEIKQNRESTLNALNLLNPLGEIIIPPFNWQANKIEKSSWFSTIHKFWRYAAIIIILLASTTYLFFINKNNTVKQPETSNSTNTELLDENMDYYISPNRCWNKRQLVITISKFK